MRCCRATPSYGDEETSAVAAARSGFCGWGGGLLLGATSNAVDNKANDGQQHWANGNSGVGLSNKLVDGVVAQRKMEHRNNNNNCSASASSSSNSGGTVGHTVLQPQVQQQQRRPGTSGLRSSNRRYSLLRCVLCNLKQNHTQTQQHQQQQQEQQNDLHQIEEGQLQSPLSPQPQAIVVAVVVGASIDHQIQQQEPQLTTNTNIKQQRRTSTGTGAGVGGVSFCARSGSSKSAHNQGGVDVHFDGCREALL